MQTIYFSHPIYTTGLKLDFFCLTKADYIRLYVVYVATFLKDTKNWYLLCLLLVNSQIDLQEDYYFKMWLYFNV